MALTVERVEDLHCHAGWRNFSFLKVTTAEGVVGWSEYTESYGNAGLSAVIHALSDHIVGSDARAVEAVSARLRALTRQAPGGMTHQAIAAIENALLDAKAKALDVPVYEMLGGPIRDSLPVYWSHCGSYRVSHADLIGVPSVRGLDDLRELGHEVATRGFRSLKSNILLFDGDKPRMFQPGFAQSVGHPELNLGPDVAAAIAAQLTALREGSGGAVEILLDLNFNFKTEGFIQLTRLLNNFELGWLELDMYDPDALHEIRRAASMPIASCESLFGRGQYRAFLDQRAIDVAIVDVVWNGLLESLRIASLADTHEVNVAPHNFYGNLASAISAHFCALIPNFRVMETDVDDVPWRDDVAAPLAVKEGCLSLPTGPGWGCEVDEAAIAEHPPR